MQDFSFQVLSLPSGPRSLCNVPATASTPWQSSMRSPVGQVVEPGWPPSVKTGAVRRFFVCLPELRNLERSRTRVNSRINDCVERLLVMNRFRASRFPLCSKMVHREGMSHCTYCGTELQRELGYCPRCLALSLQPIPRGRQWTRLMLAVGVLLGAICAAALEAQRLLAPQDRVIGSAASGSPAIADQRDAVPDDVGRLVVACGPPDRDLSSTQTDPPAPVPFRVLQYERAGLQVSFIPDVRAVRGSSSYRWVLTTVTDVATGHELSPEEVTQRLPCWAAANRPEPVPAASAAPAAGGPPGQVGTAH
jgi:hypothetical protein